jgi:adenylosuccinate lyase
MKMVERGASRQECHEQIRVLSHQAAAVVKGEGKLNDLIERIRNTPYFKPVHDELDAVLDPSLYIGRSVTIVERFCAGDVAKKLEKYSDYLAEAKTAELSI